MKHLWFGMFMCICSLTTMAANTVLQNASFETADTDDPAKAVGWGPFTESGEPPASALTAEDAKDGNLSMKLAFDGKRDGFLGIVQDVAVDPGDEVKFAGFFKNVDLKETSYVMLGLEWKKADGTEISREQAGDVTSKTLHGTDWTRFEVSGKAPKNTAKLVVTVTFYTGQAPSGAVLLDNMSIDKLSK